MSAGQASWQYGVYTLHAGYIRLQKTHSEYHTFVHWFKNTCSTSFLMHFPEDGHLSGRKMYVCNAIQDTLKGLYVLLLWLSYLIILMHGHELFRFIIIIGFLPPTIVARTRNNVTLSVHCLSRLEFACEVMQSRSLLQGHT